jgi:hypothetical protein
VPAASGNSGALDECFAFAVGGHVRFESRRVASGRARRAEQAANRDLRQTVSLLELGRAEDLFARATPRRAWRIWPPSCAAILPITSRQPFGFGADPSELARWQLRRCGISDL